MIAGAMPSEEIAGLNSIFQAIDIDNSGTITAEELREALKKKGSLLRAEELEGLLAMIDLDANGTLDYNVSCWSWRAGGCGGRRQEGVGGRRCRGLQVLGMCGRHSPCCVPVVAGTAATARGLLLPAPFSTLFLLPMCSCPAGVHCGHDEPAPDEQAGEPAQGLPSL